VFDAIVAELEAVAEELGRSVSQVALNWVLRRPTISTVVVGARNEAQLRQNLGAVEFALSDEQVARLDKASARPAAYPYWHQRRTSLDRNPPPVPV
jgi:aryl-alcohol dehydrogenase-like predicted oxidoreductase